MISEFLFFAGYMSQSAPAQHPEGQDEVGDGEAVMVLQGSWVPNEVQKLQNLMIPGAFSMACSKGRNRRHRRCYGGSTGIWSHKGFADEAGSF